MEQQQDRLRIAKELLICYLPVLLVQLAASWATATTVSTWYPTLERAPWTPPGWVFGPVWTVLYIVMTVAVWMVYRTDAPKSDKTTAYVLYSIQLFFNALWSFVFFAWQAQGWALVNLTVLMILIVWTGMAFYVVKRAAGLMLLPYLFWVGYALTLNAFIWVSNP